MFERLKTLLHAPESPGGVSAEQAVPMAAAMLLLEVAWADQKISAAELAATRKAIESMFHLAPAQVQQLVDRARTEHDSAISMYPFTRAVNEALSMDDKRALILELWRLADTDDGGEPHEEYTIRRIADLLYVSHEDFIAAKLAARKDS